MDNGDACNTSQWLLSNHIGTHIDFPRHFSAKGKILDNYPADFWIFHKAALIDLSPVTPGQLISWQDFNINNISSDIEILLVKTGFSNIRNQNIFWQENPGFHPDIANQLRESLPNVRVLGFDSISVSSYTNREIGRMAHKAFLETANPILLLEDMDLSEINYKTRFHQMLVAPMRVTGADASPCTVLAEVEKE